MYCIDCGKISYQSYNGHAYCDKHHPQRICPLCNENAGAYLRVGAWCKKCQEEYVRAHQLPLLVPYGNTGVTSVQEDSQ